MKIFRISYAESLPKKYVWASGFGPMEDMRFLHPVVLERRKEFWKVNRMESGIHLDNSKAHFPDLLGCGHPPPGYFVSERIVESLIDRGINPARVTRCKIAENVDSFAREPYQYCVLEAEPGIKVDWETMGVPIDPISGKVIRPYPKPWPPEKWIVQADSWSGEDIFTWSNFKLGDFTDLLCTERVKSLAEDLKWTNIQFDPLNVK